MPTLVFETTVRAPLESRVRAFHEDVAAALPAPWPPGLCE